MGHLDPWADPVQPFQEDGFSDRLIGPDPAYGALDEFSKSCLSLSLPSLSKVHYHATELVFMFFLIFGFVHVHHLKKLRTLSRFFRAFAAHLVHAVADVSPLRRKIRNRCRRRYPQQKTGHIWDMFFALQVAAVVVAAVRHLHRQTLSSFCSRD